MKLTHVLSSVDNSFNFCNTCNGEGFLNKNISGSIKQVACHYCQGKKIENPFYYKFIPSQIKFWSHFGIKFIALFIGEEVPHDISQYSDNIILWNKNLDLKTAYVGQHLRMYYPSLLNLPDDELVMITDMDMLPVNIDYFTRGLDKFNIQDFIHYRNISYNQVFMCYNAAHPTVWSNIFNIKSENDIVESLYQGYNSNYQGLLNNLWYSDQSLLFNKLTKYPNLKMLGRNPRRLEYDSYEFHLRKNTEIFFQDFDDAHFHRRYDLHKWMIEDLWNQFTGKIDVDIRKIALKEIEIDYLKADYYKEFDIDKKNILKEKIYQEISILTSLKGFIPGQLPNISQDFFEQEI